MSASKRHVLSPRDLKAQARFTATVDLPTPPFPEATAKIYFILDVPALFDFFT